MQILELYIRDGIKYPEFGTSAATSTSTNNLVDATADFTSGVKVGYIVFNKTDGTSAKVTAVTNATTLALSTDIFASGELYQIKSDFVRLDLFKDESVTITDSIKNTKDISKVFTPFSQQFNVPASKHNSKLFKHYEDNDVVNSFDARFRVDALIKLNGADYKKGKLRLNSVTMKDNKAHAYKLVFFGETIELKDILGEDDLSRLEFPSSLNFDYDYATIKSKFISTSGDVCFPLITHTKNMRYTNAGYKSTAGEFLNQFDIKPALKLRAIIEAIETTYDIDLSNEFFNSTDFRSIYMWLHRESGFMSNSNEGENLQVLEARFHQRLLFNGLSLASGTDIRPVNIEGLGSGTFLEFLFAITTADVDDFNLTILRSSDNSVLWNEDYTGTQNLTIRLYPSIIWNAGSSSVRYGQGIVDVKILITTSNTLTFSAIQITARKRLFSIFNAAGDVISSGVYNMTSLATSNQVIISRQIPKMKVIDFLTNIFKMFNLVAYKENNQIQALPFNDFNALGKTYDITKYVDTSKSTIEKVLKYKNVKFGFKSKQSFLIQKQQELLGNDFAGESYPASNDNEWDGGEFKVELDFEKMLYERLTNENDATELTTICQGAMLDKNFSPTIGAPLLLYIKNQATSDAFKFQNTSSGAVEDIAAYNRPSQVKVNIGVFDSSSSLNFGIEIDEFFREVVGTNLFNKYYGDYLTSIYDRQGRIKKVEAYLPLHILLKYNLNDKFIIGNKSYRINSIKTNLLTNKSSLELYTLSQSATNLSQSMIDFLPRLATLSVTATSSSSVTLAWTPAGALNTDNITGYDVYKDDEFVETLGNDIGGRTLTGLDSGITFKLAIRTRYTIDSSVVFSNDRIVYATTD
tara:strand:- start:2259 stop:4847 length:2589 start_codon:yes stop_codon:yes gene_type:complete